MHIVQAPSERPMIGVAILLRQARVMLQHPASRSIQPGDRMDRLQDSDDLLPLQVWQLLGSAAAVLF